MKKFLLLTISFLLSLTSFAQQRKLGPLKAGKTDIILTQPEGELRNYVRAEGGCCDVVYGGFVHDLTQDHSFVRVVFSPDGTKAYIQNIISRAATGAWVEGTVEGDKIRVPYGQLVYWWDAPVNPTTKQVEAPYGLKLAEVTMKGAHTQYTVKTTGNAVFRMEDGGKRLVLEGTQADLDGKNITGLGLVYTDGYDGEWSYYMDYGTVLSAVEDQPVTPPDGVVTERYSLTHAIYGHFVDVAFVRGRDVYIRGISEDYTPGAWIHGTLDEETNKIYFPAQLAGSYQVYLFYFLGADLTKRNDNYGGTYDYTLDPDSTGIVFDYDPETHSFWNNDRALVLNNAKGSLDRFERFPKPMFRPYTEKAGTPAAPAVMELNDRYWAYGYNASTLALSIPVTDEEGNFMDPSKLFYSLYVDDDEPYLLYQDEYEGLPFDAVEEIPYLYTNEKDIFPKSLGMYIYQNGFERMGIKSIYYGGGERHETAIYYTKPVTGIEEVKNGQWTMDNAVYDLSGRRVQEPKRGLYILNGKKFIVK
ncbi:MAG: hypothetical protein IJV08_06015 [Bacteroidaceae bacterium]|nr:hypothetical protein [Bacteroidaceae bacterium]